MSPTISVEQVLDKAIARAHAWLAETDSADSSGAHNSSTATERLADLVRDPAGVSFTMDFVDRVARPEDNATAARALRDMDTPPAFLGRLNRTALRLGGLLGPRLPGIVMPVARARLRQMVGHLVLDADGTALGKLLDRAAEEGTQLNLNLLGEAVLGDEEAARRAERTLALIENPKVTYVSVKASSLVAQLNPWDLEGNLVRLREQLRPLYRAAAASGTFINLDMEEYKDLRLTIRLFTELLSEDEFRDLEAGIVLQAYLPDSYGALVELAEFARTRSTPIKIRLVKGANLSMEKVEAESHGWEQAPYATKHEVDANYVRLLDHILTPEHAPHVRIGVASHNLFTVALAWELALARGVTEQIDAEMLQGMSPDQQQAVRAEVGRMILYTPVVHREDFDVAVSYLVRRLEENAAEENFLHALFAPGDQMASQEQALIDAVRDPSSTHPRRTQNRLTEDGRTVQGRFDNEPDTDPALRANREWALERLAADPHEIVAEEVSDPAVVEAAVARARELAPGWASRSGAERAEVLESIADELARSRGELVTVMAHEAGKTIDQSDPEISEAVDFAAYYGEQARNLDRARSVFTPHALTVVVPPWNFPVAIPAGGVLAALAAGSAVIIKPAPQTVACAELMVQAVHRGLERHGIDPQLVQFLRADEGEAGRRLIAHEDVDHVILTGASETAALFRSWNPRMSISAETSGKNAIVVTPAADPDLAVADIYRSAFGHSGQKCSASSLVILVGQAGESRRIREQLVDAVRTLRVGPGTDIATTMNGLIEPPGEKLARGLTQLDAGESWLLQPRQLDDEGRFWTPGIRDHVRPGSWFHRTECFGPVLGLMYAATLEEAVEWQNDTGFGLTGGLHSLDTAEIAYWAEHVEVGNAYVNRGITGAIVRRQPFGGWKNSVIGPGAKAGGPNYVAQLGTWSDGDPDHAQVQLIPAVRALLAAAPARHRDWLRTAAELDELAWREEFSREHDLTGLRSEANIFRYRPHDLQVHVGEGAAERDLLRLELAAARAGASISTDVRVTPGGRIRALGAVPDELREEAAEVGAVVLDSPVLADGRRELLPFLNEQALTVTQHRFGVLRPVYEAQ